MFVEPSRAPGKPPSAACGTRRKGGRCDLVFSNMSEVVIEKRPIDCSPCPLPDRTGRNQINLQQGRSRLDIWEQQSSASIGKHWEGMGRSLSHDWGL